MSRQPSRKEVEALLLVSESGVTVQCPPDVVAALCETWLQYEAERTEERRVCSAGNHDFALMYRSKLGDIRQCTKCMTSIYSGKLAEAAT